MYMRKDRPARATRHTNIPPCFRESHCKPPHADGYHWKGLSCASHQVHQAHLYTSAPFPLSRSLANRSWRWRRSWQLQRSWKPVSNIVALGLGTCLFRAASSVPELCATILSCGFGLQDLGALRFWTVFDCDKSGSNIIFQVLVTHSAIYLRMLPKIGAVPTWMRLELFSYWRRPAEPGRL